MLYFDTNSLKLVRISSFHNKRAGIGSVTDMAPNRRQAIILTHFSIVYWCVYVSFRLDGLTWILLIDHVLIESFFRLGEVNIYYRVSGWIVSASVPVRHGLWV